MGKNEISEILKVAMDEFPVTDVSISLPEWIHILPNNNKIKSHYLEKLRESVVNVKKIRDVHSIIDYYQDSPYITKAYISNLDIGTGEVMVNLTSSDELYQNTLEELIGVNKINKSKMIKIFSDYSLRKENQDGLDGALKMARNSGYGILYPTIKDMKLDKPEIIKQGNRYGVKLKAKASSLHLIKVDVESTFEPIIGSETQSKELIDYILKDYNEDPSSIWKSEIFGRSLESIVKEGIQAKLAMMSDNTRYKLSNTVTKIVNKGSDKLIAIVL